MRTNVEGNRGGDAAERSSDGGPSRLARLGLLALVGLLAAVSILVMAAPAPAATSGLHPMYAASAPHAAGTLVAAAPPASSLQLGIQATPHTICAFGLNTCAAGTGTARVTLTASAGSAGVLAWPAVQVAFVIETTSTDGVFDPTAGEPGGSVCAQSSFTSVLCEESNGVPFFVANAQGIANSIAAANPHTQVSFAMVDYFANINNWDDGDGAEYHVDIPQFVPASYFGAEVVSNFQAHVLNGGWYYGDSDMADNQFTSSSITALYGTVIGSGLDWSNNTHHVIVWMGSTAPRDPNYQERGCVGYENSFYCQSYGDLLATCEPTYVFPSGASPNCEGWVKSQDGNVTHSIAALVHTAPQCTRSIGNVCTIDTIDYWASTTDPLSKDWPTGVSGGGPGGAIVQADVQHVLQAGCDLAQATGGSWNGPAWYACPDGQAGTLQYVPHGPYNAPVTTNPTLFNALRQIGFGPVLQTQVAAGSGKPIFQFVPFGNIAVDTTNLQPTAACLRDGVSLRTCQVEPSVVHYAGLTYLGWNWSKNASSNVMYVGDAWTASFNVIATGPPYTTVPVDACTTVDCKAGGSTSVAGLYTSATYVPYTNNTILTQSFPLGQVAVEVTPPANPPPSVPPPPPPVPPPFAIPTAPPVPVVQQIGVGNSVGVANLSLQAAAAGFLGAGFMRVGIKNRPVAMKIAAKTGPQSSRFDAEASKKDTGIGRFE